MLLEKHGRKGADRPGSGASAPVSRCSPAADAARRAEFEATLRWLESREGGVIAAASRRTRSALARRFDRLNAPMVYPWSPSMNGAHPAHRLHRTAAALLRGRALTGPGRLWLYTKAVAWPVLAVAAAVPVVWRCWRHVRDRHGFGLREQWRDVMEGAFFHGIFPTEYYYRRVYATAAREDKSLYLNEREMIALLSAADRGSGSQRLDDPDSLYVECRKAGIPVPRNVASFSRGSTELLGDCDRTVLPEKDLFARPKVWTPGDDGDYWRWVPKTRVWSFNGVSLAAPALLKRIGGKSLARPYLLQEAVVNHPELARFSEGGLCTYKVATGIDKHGEPHLLFADFRAPGADVSGETPVAVDLTAGVGIVDGRLRPAVGEFVADGEFDHHPGTGATITGAAAPCWREVAELVRKAHRHFSDVPFVGWEISVCASGAIVLGASTNWGFFPHVLPAETKFAGLCLRHLMRNRCEATAMGSASSRSGGIESTIARAGEAF